MPTPFYFSRKWIMFRKTIQGGRHTRSSVRTQKQRGRRRLGAVVPRHPTGTIVVFEPTHARRRISSF